MELLLKREPSKKGRTYGELFIDGAHECLTLEDEVREIPGVDVAEWKVYGQTAIPSGRYRLTMETSPKFGPNTLTINAVDGFKGVRIHSGSKVEDTDGCPLVGDMRTQLGLAGGKLHHVLENLKGKVRAALDAGEECWITVQNAA